MDAVVVGDVVAVVLVGRGKKGLQPKAGDAEPREVVELARQPLEITDPVAVAVEILFDVEAVTRAACYVLGATC